MSMSAEPMPIVLVPVGTDDVALDACLAAIDCTTPAGTRLWLADNAQAGPRGQAIIARWLQTTPMQAEHTRRAAPVAASSHLDQMLSACGDGDVVVLAPDAVPFPGWLAQLAACARRDAAIATVTPWSNAGEAASWPSRSEVAAIPADRVAIAAAAAGLAWRHPELPAAVDHAVWIRGSARRRAGGVDVATFHSWYAALIDLSLRLSGLGWRNVLCENAFVGRGGEGGPVEGDLDAIAARWPQWPPRMAKFLMEDPLRELREAMSSAMRRQADVSPQPRLFD